MSLLDNILIFDVETTIYKHQVKNEEGLYNPKDKEGSAFCLPQQLVMSGFKLREDEYSLQFDVKEETQKLFDKSSLIVGFNIKFDLHWARRIGVDISNVVVWDCQLAEFMLDSQQNKYPSMNQACEKYNIPLKLDVVSEEYWEKGIDTNSIPTNILREYLYGDLERTEKIFKEQLFQFKGIRL